MPNHFSFPTLYDRTLQVSIADLKKWGYLNPGQWKSGNITWSRDGVVTADIAIGVDMSDMAPYLELKYKYKDEPRHYTVRLVKRPSNLGKGFVWYFLCPSTHKLCRKLYMVGGYFLHREAFRGCMYDSQTRSHKTRDIDRVYGSYFRADQLYDQLYRKYFKTHYARKPTKHYLRIKKQIDQAESIPYYEIERLMIK